MHPTDCFHVLASMLTMLCRVLCLVSQCHLSKSRSASISIPSAISFHQTSSKRSVHHRHVNSRNPFLCVKCFLLLHPQLRLAILWARPSKGNAPVSLAILIAKGDVHISLAILIANGDAYFSRNLNRKGRPACLSCSLCSVHPVLRCFHFMSFGSV